MASNAIKRQRKRRRIDTDGDPEFQVAPMVDVLLVLMLFFMAITSTEVLKKVKNIDLADAKHAKPNESSPHNDEIVVNVVWDGANKVAQFSLNEASYAKADDMKGALAKLIAQNPGSHVVVRADKGTEYSNISDVMAACASVGIATVSFAVLTGGSDHNAPPPVKTTSTQ